MAGNVREWANDWYSSSYYGTSPDSNPQGPVSGSSRVLRGGSWYLDADLLRCAGRNDRSPGGWNHNIGFRLAVPAWAILQHSQPEPGEDLQEGNEVKLDGLWQWEPTAGRFADPGPAGVTIYPDKPTYLLTHGWDGALEGRTCGTMSDETCADLDDPGDKPEYAMSSVAAAIWRAKGDTINLLAWDWADRSNWDGVCNSSDVLARLRDIISANCLQAGPFHDTCVIYQVWRALFASGQWLGDAFWSGTSADNEGNMLGQALAELPDLGTQLHLIGKSHGGGVMGRVAAKLKDVGRPATSITTIDTPSVFGFINTLKHVEPEDVTTRAIVLYYPWLAHGGVGAPVYSSSDKLVNMALSPAFGSFPRHLWAAGKDDCEAIHLQDGEVGLPKVAPPMKGGSHQLLGITIQLRLSCTFRMRGLPRLPSWTSWASPAAIIGSKTRLNITSLPRVPAILEESAI